MMPFPHLKEEESDDKEVLSRAKKPYNAVWNRICPLNTSPLLMPK